MPSLPIYSGEFGEPEAERLLWRAGFGPRGGEAQILAAKGFNGAVDHLVNPPSKDTLIGESPVVDGAPLAPTAAVGHDHLWWLDKMAVRTSTAAGREDDARLVAPVRDLERDGRRPEVDVLAANEPLPAARGLGSFKGLAMRVTIDPAMPSTWTAQLDQGLPERELRLRDGDLHPRSGQRLHRTRRARAGGAPSPAGPRTGRTAPAGRLYFDAQNHDLDMKVIFNKPGAFGWKDAIRLALPTCCIRPTSSTGSSLCRSCSTARPSRCRSSTHLASRSARS